MIRSERLKMINEMKMDEQDDVVRIVIPEQTRQALGWDEEDQITATQRDGAVELRKYAPGCLCCGAKADLVLYRKRLFCRNCIRALGDTIGLKKPRPKK